VGEQRKWWSSAFGARGSRVKDDPATAFPASEETPGQEESRTAYQRLRDVGRKYPWWEEYLELRAAGWTWRKAVLIAWLTMPSDRRQPETKQELAVNVLALRSDRTVRRWQRKDPRIDETVAARQAAALFQYRADIFHALGTMAATPEAKGFNDRRLALEMMGDYRPRSAVEVTGEDGGALDVKASLVGLVGELDGEELRQLIRNLETASEGRGARGEGPGAGLEGDAHPAEVDQ
jgi:hypothetical protein